MPGQPAFLARPASLQSDLSINTTHDIAFATEHFDQGADFATPSFTAPVTGKYQFNFMLHLQNIDSAAGDFVINLVASNGTTEFRYDCGKFSADVPDWSPTGAMLVDMDASDTCKMTIYQTDGTGQMDIHTDSRFSGYLAC